MRHRQLQVLVGTLLAAVVLAVGVFIGQRAAYSGLGMDPREYREMRSALPLARARVGELEAALAAADTRHEVDRAALEMLRSELAEQQEQIAGMDEGLRFYRSLMAPAQVAQGVSLRGLELVASEVQGRFAYRLVFQQEAGKHATVRGRVRVTVLGQREAQPASYLLSALSPDLEESDIALRFRYFQAVEGELQLPEGFVPEALVVKASIESPRERLIEERFPWQLQERFTHVGK